MTLPEADDKMTMMATPQSGDEIGEVIRLIMLKSFEESRLSCGACDCALQLEMNPEHVLICILPEIASQSIQIRIQHTLIEAYCREHCISLLKVGSISTALSKLFKTTDTFVSYNNDANNNTKQTHAPLERKSSTRDFSCFLVRRPDILSSEEQWLTGFCENIKQDEKIVIKIPS